jgi:MFS transporter, BCD family, chlorophyll transporter
VGLMYVMLLLGMFCSALILGALLAEFSPGRLVQVIQGCALATLVLNTVALWKQECRHSARAATRPDRDLTFAAAWAGLRGVPHATRCLTAVGLGTMAFGMADILLEPYGGLILGLTVGSTTTLSAVLALGGLLGFSAASIVLARGADPYRVAGMGALIGLPAFACVILAAPLDSPLWFGIGNFLVGFGAATFGHGTLTATMGLAPRAQTGLTLGAWGAVQATAAGVGVALSGVVRDAVNAFSAAPGIAGRSINGFLAVYGIEILLLGATLVVVLPLMRRAAGAATAPFGGVSRAAR